MFKKLLHNLRPRVKHASHNHRLKLSLLTSIPTACTIPRPLEDDRTVFVTISFTHHPDIFHPPRTVHPPPPPRNRWTLLHNMLHYIRNGDVIAEYTLQRSKCNMDTECNEVVSSAEGCSIIDASLHEAKTELRCSRTRTGEGVSMTKAGCGVPEQLFSTAIERQRCFCQDSWTGRGGGGGLRHCILISTFQD